MLDETYPDRRRHETWDDGSLVVRAARIPWTPWALPGTHFKLLDYNRNTSWFVFLLKVDEDAPAVLHKHIGAANAYILEGGFSYDKGGVREGDFFCEAGGVSHTPQVDPGGCVMLGFSNGALVGIGEDGEVAGLIDVDWMVDAARANDAFAHLEGARRT